MCENFTARTHIQNFSTQQELLLENSDLSQIHKIQNRQYNINFTYPNNRQSKFQNNWESDIPGKNLQIKIS